mmetsp:Transcript_10610/g.24151  ORF Transcript_10610/g.24151 Transcript_10610/m.24151 type:complete len:221 (-) Transcript_10610:10-672(-)
MLSGLPVLGLLLLNLSLLAVSSFFRRSLLPSFNCLSKFWVSSSSSSSHAHIRGFPKPAGSHILFTCWSISFCFCSCISSLSWNCCISCTGSSGGLLNASWTACSCTHMFSMLLVNVSMSPWTLCWISYLTTPSSASKVDKEVFTSMGTAMLLPRCFGPPGATERAELKSPCAAPAVLPEPPKKEPASCPRRCPAQSIVGLCRCDTALWEAGTQHCSSTPP